MTFAAHHFRFPKMRMNPATKISLFAGVWILSSVASGKPGPATRGFVVTDFAPAIYQGDQQCPDGLPKLPDTQTNLAKLPPAERARLLLPANRRKLCSRFPEESHHFTTVVKGKLSYGLNLDGSDGTTPRLFSCAHEDFVGPNGERGIDNQWYRAIGCLQESSPGGALHEYFNKSMRHGDFAILIEIAGIDDARNDDDVQVGFYRAANPAASTRHAANGKTSQQTHYDRYFHSVAHGRIVNGILTTEPVDMRFKGPPEILELAIRDARVKMTLEPSGQLSGILGGYQEFRALYEAAFQTLDSERVLGPMSCRGFVRTAPTLFDGNPASKDGPCSWISVAYEIRAMPVTVVHSQVEHRLVTKETPESQPWWSKFLWWEH